MSFLDELRVASVRALGAAGGVLNDWARDNLAKADDDGPETSPGGGQANTAVSSPVPTEPAVEDPKSLFFDPFAIIEQLGYKDKPTNLSYGILKSIVYRCPIIYAIINNRIQQVSVFARSTHDRYQLGYRIKLRDSTRKPTRVERNWITQMEGLIERTGVTDNPRGRDSLETFLRKLTWDSLVYDQACFEIVPGINGKPCEWYAVDAATMRLADSASTYKNEDSAATRYVQVYDGMVIAEYTQEELCFGVRNPRTDIMLYGYGVSELEELITTVTCILWAWQYNQNMFRQGTASKGLLNLKGTMPEKQLQAFRRHWYQLISGVENAWRTPILNAEEVQWLNMQPNSRDMEYNAWMDFLIKVACAIFSTDPVEVNFKYGNTGQKSGLQEGSNKEKVTESKERGLRPLLGFLQRCINHYIVWPINESFMFEFVGLDALTREEIATLNQKRVRTFLTVDELRAEDDLPPLPDGKGEVILDSVWLQYAQMREGVQVQAQQVSQGDMGEGEPDQEPTDQKEGKLSSVDKFMSQLESEEIKKSWVIDL